MARSNQSAVILIILILSVFWVTTSHASGLTGRATWYNLGLTACGTHHSNSEYVAAVGWSYWTNPNPNLDPMCQKSAIVTDPQSGRSVTVRIKDICGSCTVNDIDLSPAAFQALRPLDVGMFTVNWELIDSGGGDSCVGTVTADVLNIRSIPSSQGVIVGRLNNGQIVTLQSRTIGENIGGNTGWFYVGNGYVSGYYLRLNNPPRPDWCY